MKKIIVFFCDIAGTIIGSERNSNNDYQIFNDLLLEIKALEQVDYIVFSLISSDNNIIVNKEQSILSNYFNDCIILGKQFFDNGYIIDNKIYNDNKKGKIEQILTYTKELEQKYMITKIYYADDCEFSHYILNSLAYAKNCNDLFKSIIPKKHIGLKELNIIINDNILSNELHNIKK